MAQIFRFKVMLRSMMCNDFPKNHCTRTIEVKNTSLKRLAGTILETYGMEMDHAFGFYNNLNNLHRSDEVYTLFADMEDMHDPHNGKSVKTRINAVFSEGKTMVFLFDYGDEWIFHVQCLSIQPEQKGNLYPQIIESHGEAPPQYPDMDEIDTEDA